MLVIFYVIVVLMGVFWVRFGRFFRLSFVVFALAVVLGEVSSSRRGLRGGFDDLYTLLQGQLRERHRLLGAFLFRFHAAREDP